MLERDRRRETRAGGTKCTEQVGTAKQNEQRMTATWTQRLERSEKMACAKSRASQTRYRSQWKKRERSQSIHTQHGSSTTRNFNKWASYECSAIKSTFVVEIGNK